MREKLGFLGCFFFLLFYYSASIMDTLLICKVHPHYNYINYTIDKNLNFSSQPDDYYHNQCSPSQLLWYIFVGDSPVLYSHLCAFLFIDILQLVTQVPRYHQRLSCKNVASYQLRKLAIANYSATLTVHSTPIATAIVQERIRFNLIQFNSISSILPNMEHAHYKSTHTIIIITNSDCIHSETYEQILKFICLSSSMIFSTVMSSLHEDALMVSEDMVQN